MKTAAIIQARLTSTRLPGKVLMNLGGKSILENILDRVSRAEYLDEIIVATSIEDSDNRIEDLLREKSFHCFRGSLSNVLERFYLCAKEYKADIIVRLTADNPMIDPGLIDEAVKIFTSNNIDYLYYKDSLPLGMCIEVFSFSALAKAYNEAKDPECLEHVTPYMRKNPGLFSVLFYKDPGDFDYSFLRFTVDTQHDYDFASHVYDYFGGNSFSYVETLEALKTHPEWAEINRDIQQKKVNYTGEQ